MNMPRPYRDAYERATRRAELDQLRRGSPIVPVTTACQYCGKYQAHDYCDDKPCKANAAQWEDDNRYWTEVDARQAERDHR